MLLNCGVGEDSWESLGLQGDPTSPFYRKLVLNSHWKDWCWSWNSNTLATLFEELTHLKRVWCWEWWKAGGEGDDRGWDDWMASLTGWTWVWVNSRSWWWTGKPGILQSMGSQRVGHDWATELNSIITRLTWVALPGRAHGFIELDKAVVHVITLVSFLWLWFSFSLPSDGREKEAYGSFLMGKTDWGKNWVLFWWAGPCSVNS